MDDDFFRSRRFMERTTTCLISNTPYQNGGGRCSPPASRIQKSWTNWKVIRARIGQGGCSREKSEEQVFEGAVQGVGQASLLKYEFAKLSGKKWAWLRKLKGIMAGAF